MYSSKNSALLARRSEDVGASGDRKEKTCSSLLIHFRARERSSESLVKSGGVRLMKRETVSRRQHGELDEPEALETRLSSSAPSN